MDRSENMRRIRGRDTRPEIALREALADASPQPSGAPVGRPDLVFPDLRVAVFVHGCQWHGCPDHYARPRTRAPFWADKLDAALQRDRRQTAALEALGWRVVAVWEHEIVVDLPAAVARVRRALDGPTPAGPDWRVARVDVIDDDRRIERRHLVDLQDPAQVRTVEGRRVTAKGRRLRTPQSVT